MPVPQFLLDLLQMLLDLAVPAAFLTLTAAGVSLRHEGGTNFHVNGRTGKWVLWTVVLLTLPQLLSWIAAQGIKTITQYEQSAAKYEQQVMYPLAAINQAKSSVMQAESQFTQVSNMFRTVNVSSATLPQSQNLESLLLSRNASNVPTVSTQFQQVYGVVMAQNTTSPAVRNMTDMSIIYSLAIAVIPFIAKRIISGDVGSTAGALIGAAATALTVGAAAVEGVVAGSTAAGAGGSGSGAGGSAVVTSTGKGGSDITAGGSNQPTRPQGSPRLAAQNLADQAFGGFGGGATIEGHAEQMRSSLSDALAGDDTSSEGETTTGAVVPGSNAASADARGGSSTGSGGGRSSQPARRGPNTSPPS
jgi:hypothetical protein